MKEQGHCACKVNVAWKERWCKSIHEYLEQAFGKSEGKLLAFRGAPAQFENLRPTIDRYELVPKDAVREETLLFERFREEAWPYFSPQEKRRCLIAETRWESVRNTGLLVVARHRLLPTRCLDWTTCPLHALFFACSGDHRSEDAEIWWFDLREFEHAAAFQWPRLFGRPGNVTPEIESDFIHSAERHPEWFTLLDYNELEGDRLHLQKAFITVSGHLDSCHAQEIDRLGVRNKGRLLIPAELKAGALRLLHEMGIDRDSLGLKGGEEADRIAKEIGEEFTRKHANRGCFTG